MKERPRFLQRTKKSAGDNAPYYLSSGYARLPYAD